MPTQVGETHTNHDSFEGSVTHLAEGQLKVTTQITTVHANPDSFEGLVTRLSELVKNSPTYKTEYSPEAVLERLKINLQYNSTPAVSYLKVGVEDAKIILQLLEANSKQL